jgi:hypothetical protein
MVSTHPALVLVLRPMLMLVVVQVVRVVVVVAVVILALVVVVVAAALACQVRRLQFHTLEVWGQKVLLIAVKTDLHL